MLRTIMKTLRATGVVNLDVHTLRRYKEIPAQVGTIKAIYAMECSYKISTSVYVVLGIYMLWSCFLGNLFYRYMTHLMGFSPPSTWRIIGWTVKRTSAVWQIPPAQYIQVIRSSVTGVKYKYHWHTCDCCYAPFWNWSSLYLFPYYGLHLCVGGRKSFVRSGITTQK